MHTGHLNAFARSRTHACQDRGSPGSSSPRRTSRLSIYKPGNLRASVSCDASPQFVELLRGTLVPTSDQGNCILARRSSLLGLTALVVEHPWQGKASSTTGAAMLPRLRKYTSGSCFSLMAPEDWVVVYDRSKEQVNGAVLLMGNFKNFDTFTVTRDQLGEGAAAGVSGASDLPRTVQVLVEEQRDQEAETLEGTDGQQYCCAEFVVQTCRGDIIEGSGGARRCVGPNDRDLQLISRHTYLAMVVQGGYVYTLKAASTIARWDQVADNMLTAIKTFRFL